LDEAGAPLRASDTSRRFFEAVWVHEHEGRYYLSYSTGDTHLLVYAVGASPEGPFTYRGVLLQPVRGWTTHHSIVKFEHQWWLMHHDASLSNGDDARRCVKAARLLHEQDGSIQVHLGRAPTDHSSTLPEQPRRG